VLRRRRRVPAGFAFLCRWLAFFFAFAIVDPFFLLGLPITRLIISGVGFRLRWVVRRGAALRAVFRRARRRVGLARFAAGRCRCLAAAFRRFPPKPALICFALNLRFAILVLFLAGLTTLVSTTE
jgi:hypothetical protein